MKADLEKLIEGILREYFRRKGLAYPGSLAPEVIVTKDPSHGDCSSNAAFKIAKIVEDKPNRIADELVLLIEQDAAMKAEPRMIERVEVAGSGFINFYLSKDSLAQVLYEVRKNNQRYGESDFGKGRKVLLEFVSANPTGPLTIAHGRQAAIGDALARILKATGHQVTKEYYLNDSGRQMQILGASLWSRYQNELGRAADLPEDGYRGAYLIDIAKKLIEKKQDSLLKEKTGDAVAFCRKFAEQEIMAGIREDLDRVGISFDAYFREGTLFEKGLVDKALDLLRAQGHLYEQDGALWFRSTTFGDDKDRVIKKSSGEYTYLAPDIAYHRHKFERGHQWLINLLGPDHHGYLARLKAACQAMGHDPKKIDIRIVQLTTLFRKGVPVRMSTRAGEFVTLRELVDEVGVDATRFFFVMRRVESHLDFDLELAKEKSQDNPVYYLQYAHARIASLLRFAQRAVAQNANLNLLATVEETNLIKLISEFPKALVLAAQTMEPYRVADYLRDLAAGFHKFYSAHRIVTEDEELTRARLILADATCAVLRNGLELLGISQPDSM